MYKKTIFRGFSIQLFLLLVLDVGWSKNYVS